MNQSVFGKNSRCYVTTYDEKNGSFAFDSQPLGVARYRVGQFAAALETLTRSDKINSAGPDGPQPADIAFLAMTQQQLGQPAPARATLARLRETLQQDPLWAYNTDAQAFLREAVALIEGVPAKQKE